MEGLPSSTHSLGSASFAAQRRLLRSMMFDSVTARVSSSACSDAGAACMVAALAAVVRSTASASANGASSCGLCAFVPAANARDRE